ncbi:hypothetical protein BVC80_1835g616 [Macleaya cordata]|uniref:Uncharacterized protein n=1 Tax=Macleaya cordata TaxID=56857 RepID=A0A200R644_MACCD|nr:hypothetical protein BVC80_1835g616 [Macleaya cordata]
MGNARNQSAQKGRVRFPQKRGQIKIKIFKMLLRSVKALVSEAGQGRRRREKVVPEAPKEESD